MFIFIIIILCAILFIYLFTKYKVYSFKKYGIKYLEPVPLLGNLHRSIFGLEHLSVMVKKIYDSCPNDRYFALFEMVNPSIILRDSELVKRVTIKDFDHFHDIPFQIDENIDSIFGRTLFSLKGEKWHQMRSAASPAFTSFKIKHMFVYMKECAQRVTQFYTEQISATSNSYEIDAHDIGSRFTVDVIASTAFSFEVDSCKERDNRFFKDSCSLFAPNLSLTLKFTGFRVFPRIMKMLKIKLLANEAVDFFKSLIKQTIQQREQSGLVRMDMMHLLLEAKKGSLKHEEDVDHQVEFASTQDATYGKTSTNIKWTDDDLIAQALIFIIAGHQTTSSVFSFLMHELVVNPDIQERLRDEIDALVEKCEGNVSYDELIRLKYLDMVVSECLRRWPPIPFTTRLCIKDYDMGPVRDGSSDHIVIKKGENIWTPVHAIHMDPNLWTDPERFDPERFSEDNIKNIKSQSFLPFGSGPRSCIGSRFALLNLKVMVFYLLQKFTFEACSKTVIPMRVNPKTLFMESKDGYWMTMKLRNNQ